MSQININDPATRTYESTDRSTAAGINLLTVLIVLAVLAVLAWFLFTGPLANLGNAGAGAGTNSGQTNITINPPSNPGGNTTQPGGGAGTGTQPGGSTGGTGR